MFSIFLIISIYSFNSCQLNGYESGVCLKKSEIFQELPFCQNFVPAELCAPIFRDFWPNDTNTTRDDETQRVFIQNIQNRFLKEFSNQISLALTTDLGCFYSYKDFLCKWNFPPCDREENTTEKICQTKCIQFYSSCSLDPTPCLQKYTKMVIAS